MKRLLRWMMLAVLMAAGLTQAEAQGGRTWTHPDGLYSLTVPEGWNISSSNGSLKISSGDSWGIFDTATNQGSALDVAQKSAAQMKPMVSEWNVMNQGTFTTPNHHPSGGITASCSVSTKTGETHRVMLFVAQGAGSGHFLTMTSSADAAHSKEVNGLLMQAFNSVKFGGE
jgi:hypothetical protein